MNAKTAKLICRYASALKRHPRGIKKFYNRLPEAKRHEVKQEMRSVVFQVRTNA